MKEKLLWTIFVVLVACGLAAAIQTWNRRAGKARAPDFRLVDRTGKTVTRRDLIGEVWLAEFIFLRCQASCPKMYSAMDAIRAKVPEARYVSFTVDPEHDTPEEMAKKLPTLGLDQPGWWWLSGASREEMQRVAHGFLRPASTTEEIVHSEHFFLVDRYGRVRGSYPVIDALTLARDPEVMARLEADLRTRLAEPYLPVTKLPAVNASLNATSFVLLVIGLCLIKAKRVGAHKAAMLSALASSSLFLVSYLTAHYFLGATPYAGEGWRRPVYFTILISHTVLAAVIVPLAGITLYRAFREQFDRHRRIASWTLPLWLYVSVTGVVIYFMLY
jgi:protein SCO1